MYSKVCMLVTSRVHYWNFGQIKQIKINKSIKLKRVIKQRRLSLGCLCLRPKKYDKQFWVINLGDINRRILLYFIVFLIIACSCYVLYFSHNLLFAYSQICVLCVGNTFWQIVITFYYHVGSKVVKESSCISVYGYHTRTHIQSEIRMTDQYVLDRILAGDDLSGYMRLL